MRLVDHEQRELRDRSFVVQRVTQMDGGEPGDVAAVRGDETARVGIGHETRQTLRHHTRLRRISQLAAQTGQRLGVGRRGVTNRNGHSLAFLGFFLLESPASESKQPALRIYKNVTAF
jgi:hypothetical protein